MQKPTSERERCGRVERADATDEAMVRVWGSRGAAEVSVAAIVQTLPVMLVVYDARVDETWVNDEFVRVTGWSREAAAEGGLMALCYPRREERDRAWRHMRSLSPEWLDLRLTTRDGRELVTSWTNVALPGDHYLGVGRDVTQQRATEADLRQSKAQAEHLVGELGHRIQNVLGVVQAIATETLRAADGLEDFSRGFTGRLAALGRANAQLTASSWRGTDLRALIAAVLEPLRPGEDWRLRLSGQEAPVPPKVALALTLALHELATNCVKFGAWSDGAGELRLRWRLEGRRLVLHWEEHGGPTVVPPAASGFGLDMIRRTLAYDLGGHASVEFAPAGVRCVLELGLE